MSDFTDVLYSKDENVRQTSLVSLATTMRAHRQDFTDVLEVSSPWATTTTTTTTTTRAWVSSDVTDIQLLQTFQLSACHSYDSDSIDTPLDS